MTIWRMRIAFWITKAINTRQAYVLLPSHGNNGYENAPRCYVYTYTLCLVILKPMNSNNPVVVLRNSHPPNTCTLNKIHINNSWCHNGMVCSVGCEGNGLNMLRVAVYWTSSRGIKEGWSSVAYRGGGCSNPPKFRRYRRSPRSHKQEEPVSRFPFADHCVLIRL